MVSTLGHAPTYAITGIRDGIGPGDRVPLRVEVDSLYPSQTREQALQVTLYIYALHEFQELDPNEKLSYFQVSGIHGLPYRAWDEHTKPQTPDRGYCTHDSILFPCWHRPYMLLYEQRLYEIMLDVVIPKFVEGVQKELRDAAATFRLPYWDWAEKKLRPGKDKPQYDLPEIAKVPKIEIVSYDGVSTAFVDNPMYRFTMPQNEAMGSAGITDVTDTSGIIPFSKSRGTSRWAPYEPESDEVSAQWQEGVVNNDLVVKALNEHKWTSGDNIPIAEMTYRLFLPKYLKTFQQFATTKYQEVDDASSYLSLEYVHNNIHNWSGGLDGYMGHMAEVVVAAFDPIFWLHHCNIDRLFAIWQALNVDNPSNWFDDPSEQFTDGGTWSIPDGAIDTPKTPLAPFHRDTSGTYFTSDDIANWQKLGYSYPELQPWLDKYYRHGKFNQSIYLGDIGLQLKNLYSRPIPTSPFTLSPPDYFINVRYKRFALGGVPYTIYFFIGKIGEDYTDPLHQHPALVGIVYNFSSPIDQDAEAPGCGNCRRNADEGGDSTGQVPITGALYEHKLNPRLSLESLEELFVTAYLKENLHWKIKTHGGDDIPIPEDDPFVKISVFSGIAEHFDNALSRYHSHRALHEITRLKPGGFRGEDDSF